MLQIYVYNIYIYTYIYIYIDIYIYICMYLFMCVRECVCSMHLYIYHSPSYNMYVIVHHLFCLFPPQTTSGHGLDVLPLAIWMINGVSF